MPNADSAFYVIAHPATDLDSSGSYEFHNVAFPNKEKAIAHATEFLAEWVDYAIMPVGEPVFTYTWNDDTGATQIDSSERPDVDDEPPRLRPTDDPDYNEAEQQEAEQIDSSEDTK